TTGPNGATCLWSDNWPWSWTTLPGPSNSGWPIGTARPATRRRELAVRLTDALHALPDHYAEVIIWHHLHRLSFPEVAQRLGRSVDSVKKVWVRALARLRQMLGEPE